MDTFFAVLCALIIYTYLSIPSSKRDTTDGVERSGLILYTDAATGVQYVGTALGGLAVRVDADGKPYKETEQ